MKVLVVFFLVVACVCSVPYGQSRLDRLRRMQPDVQVVHVPDDSLTPPERDAQKPIDEQVAVVDVPAGPMRPSFGSMFPFRGSAANPFGVGFPFFQARPVGMDFGGFGPVQQPGQPDDFFGTAFFRRISTMMNRMQDDMEHLWQQVNTRQGQQNTGTIQIGGETVSNINLGDLPPNYSNTTSTKKIIDGQVVEINSTIHKTTNNNTGASSFFQVQVINRKPENPGTLLSGVIPQVQTEKTPQLPLELSQRKPEENEVAPPESFFPHIPIIPSEPLVNSNDVEEIKVEHPIDLSSDLRVNQLLADESKSGKLFRIAPDAEIIDIEHGKVVGTASDLQQQMPMDYDLQYSQ